LDAAVFTGGTLAKAVQHRMAERGITEISIYLNQLRLSVQELEALIEAVIVPETWFFRDKEPFALLQNDVANKWMCINPKQVLRVLSVPCSTGEEPYSIAIALIETGLTPEQFQIDAVDISRRSLRLAQQAIYDKHSFRGTDLAFQQRYFTPTAAGYCLCEVVRRSVHFQHGNIVDLIFALDRFPYDVIFCRNLLIYFDSVSRERTVQVLNRLLNSQGLLFVGHAETALLPAAQFVPVRHPFAFAYRKAERSRQPSSSNYKTQLSNRPVNKATSAGDGPGETAKNNLGSGLKQPSANRNESNREQSNREFQTEFQQQNLLKQNLLGTARQLANQGCLQEAAQQCQAYLNQHRTSAEAYALLGQVHQAMGQERQAEQCFQKALYLNPKHLEALMHLALLLEQQGDFNGAATVRQRIQRLS
jgi:chemotaxis protein methyltransferase WspC